MRRRWSESSEERPVRASPRKPIAWSRDRAPGPSSRRRRSSRSRSWTKSSSSPSCTGDVQLDSPAMHATEEGRAQVATQTWVWPVVLVGAAIMVTWAWFIVGFLSEPSAVGRARIVLVTHIVHYMGAALGLLQRPCHGVVRRWGDRRDPRADRDPVQPQLLEKLSYFDASLTR